MASIVLENYQKRIFYHATHSWNLESIAKHGLKVWREDDEDGRLRGGGNLGAGLYITCDFRVALYFGEILFRVSIRPGTKILNSVLPPDVKCISYIKREFGDEILKSLLGKLFPKIKSLNSLS